MEGNFGVSKQHKTTLLDVLKGVLILGGPALFILAWYLLERFL
jgi:hypothetical protein